MVMVMVMGMVLVIMVAMKKWYSPSFALGLFQARVM
jgi:hypothetical protein